MRRHSRGRMVPIGARVSARFRALDRRLHIDHRGRSEWIWAVPIGGFLLTFALFALQGTVVSGVTPALWVPVGLLIAGVIGGMSIAYMTPEPDGGASDDGGSTRRDPPPDQPHDDWSSWLRRPPDELPDEPGRVPRAPAREPAATPGER